MREKSASAPVQAGATYKFVVRSAEEAVQTIREQLGENARVLSVRQMQAPGLGGFFGKPKLEVIAQVAAAAEQPAADAQAGERLRAGEPAAAREPGRDLGAGQPTSAELATDTFFPNAHAGEGTTAAPAVNPSSARTGSPPARAQRRAVEPSTLLPELLRRSGFSESLLGRLQATPGWEQNAARPLHQSLVEMGRVLRRDTAARPARPLPARVAFLGSAGVGRTTALCKWLAREVFTQRRTGRVLKAEFDRPNSAEGLAVFCEALGLTLEHVTESDAVAPAGPDAAAEPAFTYADVPALSLHNPAENRAIAKFLDAGAFTGRVLVLNAVYDLPTLRAAYAAGRELGATHLVFTHLDELAHWGKLWDFLLDGTLTPLFIATGPSLTGDCEEDTFGAVLRKTLPGA